MLICITFKIVSWQPRSAMRVAAVRRARPGCGRRRRRSCQARSQL